MRSPELQTIFAIDAIHIPYELEDACLDIDDIFPFHSSTGIILVEDDGNPFSEWLKTIGYVFRVNEQNWIGVWGT